MSLEFNEEAVSWIAQHGYEEAYGARPIKRLVQDEVKKPLADELLFGSLEKGGLVKVTVKDDKLVFAFPEK